LYLRHLLIRKGMRWRFSHASADFQRFLSLFISGWRRAIRRRSWKPRARNSGTRWHITIKLWREWRHCERLKGQSGQKANVPELERRIIANHRAAMSSLRAARARTSRLKADLTPTRRSSGNEELTRRTCDRRTRQKEFEDKVRKLESSCPRPDQGGSGRGCGGPKRAAFSVGDLGDTMKSVEAILSKRYECRRERRASPGTL